eukprot:1893841-Alexandrium_andersonii.AAC.1
MVWETVCEFFTSVFDAAGTFRVGVEVSEDTLRAQCALAGGADLCLLAAPRGDVPVRDLAGRLQVDARGERDVRGVLRHRRAAPRPLGRPALGRQRLQARAR